MSTYDYTFKLLLLGDSNIEKATLTKRYCYNIFNPSERLTIGVDFHVKTIEIHGRRIKLQIWDVGGEERFRFLLPTYCLGANGAFLLYDITQPQTLDNINEWTSIIRQKGGPIPIILIGSKLDLAENQREVPREYGVQIAENNNLTGFAEVSSKTGQNVNQIFEVMAETMLERFSIGRNYIRSVERIPEKNISIKREIPSKLKINDYLTLRLENGKTNIYVGGRLFNQCKYLLLNIPKNNISKFEKIESIDEAAIKLNKKMEMNNSIIPPETEFWGHCSNIQAWYENSYDTRLLHRNLAFPLLRALANAGDTLAKKVFKEEIALRFESGYPSVVLYLINQGYLNYLNQEELNTVLGSPKFLENLPKWFFEKDVPKWLIKKIRTEISRLYCPYCGIKLTESLNQKIYNRKSIRCKYCYTTIFKKE